MTVSAPAQPTGAATGIVSAATRPAADMLRELGVTADEGLSSDEVARRQAQYGPNAVSSHRARLLPVHQLWSPLLGLLLAAAIASYFIGEHGGAVIIGLIVGLSVGLGFVNEYRAEKAAEALHSQVSHQTVVVSDGRSTTVDVTTLVPGNLVELRLGDIVPADIRLLAVTGLECDESVLTGESLPVDKNTTAVPEGTPTWRCTSRSSTRCCSRALAGMVVGYLVLIEIGKRIFYGAASPAGQRYSRHPHLRRRAAYSSTATRQPGLSSTKP